METSTNTVELTPSELALEETFKDNEHVIKACEIVKKYCTGERKGGSPEHSHPYAVAALASQGFDDDACIVALLHDMIEDHGKHYTVLQLRKDFPTYIVNDVIALTQYEAYSKQKYFSVVNTSNDRVQNIKAWDRYHNLSETMHFGLDRRKEYLEESKEHVLSLPSLNIETKVALSAMINQIAVINILEEFPEEIIASRGTETVSEVTEDEDPNIFDYSELFEMDEAQLVKVLHSWVPTVRCDTLNSHQIIELILKEQMEYVCIDGEGSDVTETDFFEGATDELMDGEVVELEHYGVAAWSVTWGMFELPSGELVSLAHEPLMGSSESDG